MEHYLPNVIVMQLGIVDCAPRFFKKNGIEHILLNRILPKTFRSVYVDHVKKTRRRDPNNAYVLPDQFMSNCGRFFERAKGLSVEVLVVLISTVSEEVLGKSPLLNNNIATYNSIYNDLAAKFENISVIRPFDAKVSIASVTVDGYHFNSIGHSILFGRILKELCPK